MSAAVVYIRVSTAEQVENHSLATQEKACREFCARQGLAVVEVFREEGESAKTAARPQLQRLINFCLQHGRQRDITTLVVYKIDRLARAVHDHVVIRQQMKSLGIQIRSTMEAFDDSPQGTLVEGMMALLAQFDNEIRAVRTRDGMREAASAGRWVWQAPIGYRKPTPSPGAPSLEPDPDRAALVASAFEDLACGAYSRSAALERVTRRGLRSQSGRPVAKQTFHRLLVNPLYAGRVVVARWDLDVAGDFDALVSWDVFEAVQARLNTSTTHPAPRRRDHPDFPLRRVVICDACGTPLTGSWSRGRSKRYGYYRCREFGRAHVNVRREELEDQLVAHLASQSVAPGVVALFQTIVEDAWEQRRTAALAAEDRLLKKIEGLNVKRDRLVEAFVHERAIDRATYELHSARLTAEIEACRRDLGLCDDQVPDLKATFAFAESLLTDLAGWWSRLDAPGRVGLVRALYPSGLRYGAAGFGTTESPLLLPSLAGSSAPASLEVRRAGCPSPLHTRESNRRGFLAGVGCADFSRARFPRGGGHAWEGWHAGRGRLATFSREAMAQGGFWVGGATRKG